MTSILPTIPLLPTATASTAQPPSLSRNYIRENDNVLLRLPSTLIKPIKITQNGTISLGKYGSFKSSHLIGRTWGDTYEIIERGQLAVAVVYKTLLEIASTGAQKLTAGEIQQLKEGGLSGREMIARQIEEHTAFELKTEYSKEKYLKRKEAKYLPLFTPLEPTSHAICEYNFTKESSKIQDLRPDTLGQIMLMANVRPGGKVLVVESTGGLIVGACLERMGGEGQILVINDADSPPDLHLLESFNFSQETLDQVSSIHWAATELEYVPPELPMELEEEDGIRLPLGGEGKTAEGAVGEGKKRNKSKIMRELTKLRRRKAVFDRTRKAREDFFEGGYDGVIIATEYDPWSVLERLLPSIAGSASIVIHSPYLSVLQTTYLSLKSSLSILSPLINEPFLRKYQVLPGRLHPEMQGLGHGGFLLSCMRIFESEGARSVMSEKRRGKREADRVGREREEGGKRVKQEEEEEEVQE